MSLCGTIFKVIYYIFIDFSYTAVLCLIFSSRFIILRRLFCLCSFFCVDILIEFDHILYIFSTAHLVYWNRFHPWNVKGSITSFLSIQWLEWIQKIVIFRHEVLLWANFWYLKWFEDWFICKPFHLIRFCNQRRLTITLIEKND